MQDVCVLGVGVGMRTGEGVFMKRKAPITASRAHSPLLGYQTSSMWAMRIKE